MKKTKAGFILKPDLFDSNGLVAEFETDRINHPEHFGEIYILNGWLDIYKARQLRDFLNEVLPP